MPLALAVLWLYGTASQTLVAKYMIAVPDASAADDRHTALYMALLWNTAKLVWALVLWAAPKIKDRTCTYVRRTKALTSTHPDAPECFVCDGRLYHEIKVIDGQAANGEEGKQPGKHAAVLTASGTIMPVSGHVLVGGIVTSGISLPDEASHLEASHLEASRLEASRPEASHLEASHLEASRLGASHLGAPDELSPGGASRKQTSMDAASRPGSRKIRSTNSLRSIREDRTEPPSIQPNVDPVDPGGYNANGCNTAGCSSAEGSFSDETDKASAKCFSELSLESHNGPVRQVRIQISRRKSTPSSYAPHPDHALQVTWGSFLSPTGSVCGGGSEAVRNRDSKPGSSFRTPERRKLEYPGVVTPEIRQRALRHPFAHVFNNCDHFGVIVNARAHVCASERAHQCACGSRPATAPAAGEGPDIAQPSAQNKWSFRPRTSGPSETSGEARGSLALQKDSCAASHNTSTAAQCLAEMPETVSEDNWLRQLRIRLFGACFDPRRFTQDWEKRTEDASFSDAPSCFSDPQQQPYPYNAYPHNAYPYDAYPPPPSRSLGLAYPSADYYGRSQNRFSGRLGTGQFAETPACGAVSCSVPACGVPACGYVGVPGYPERLDRQPSQVRPVSNVGAHATNVYSTKPCRVNRPSKPERPRRPSNLGWQPETERSQLATGNIAAVSGDSQAAGRGGRRYESLSNRLTKSFKEMSRNMKGRMAPKTTSERPMWGDPSRADSSWLAPASAVATRHKTREQVVIPDWLLWSFSGVLEFTGMILTFRALEGTYASKCTTHKHWLIVLIGTLQMLTDHETYVFSVVGLALVLIGLITSLITGLTMEPKVRVYGENHSGAVFALAAGICSSVQICFHELLLSVRPTRVAGLFWESLASIYVAVGLLPILKETGVIDLELGLRNVRRSIIWILVFFGSATISICVNRCNRKWSSSFTRSLIFVLQLPVVYVCEVFVLKWRPPGVLDFVIMFAFLLGFAVSTTCIPYQYVSHSLNDFMFRTVFVRHTGSCDCAHSSEPSFAQCPANV
ncbi:putative transmembrane protein [Gregarina niphandrodes]|uniref:Transmembrane protein n=1 Tax=Gregarina niphandrodes TaxID=110365 RepID=A0A023BBL6_GRENI|nr:putative transmembrane protein [Gregarina niphandrodes]EZG79611.1 putative transmembrane protein [Gregarina niphandrodes]|eukprot:XP_011134407.1 putative transmembrane protein [Gregarina niphandrodes]